MTASNDLAVRAALEAAGVEFIAENGGGPGVRLKKTKSRDPEKIAIRPQAGERVNRNASSEVGLKRRE